MEEIVCYHKLEKRSLFNAHYLFLDTPDYLADILFIPHKVRVYFDEEAVRPDSSYRIIFCHIRKQDEGRFLRALDELPGKMLLFGHTDYPDVCKRFKEALGANNAA